MEEESYLYKLSPEPRLNYTDPVVRHDPTLEKNPIAKVDVSPDTGDIFEGNNGAGDTKRYDGILIPVVLLNQTVLSSQSISSLTINYDGFVPSISLTVSQQGNEIETSDSPGMNNIITVVITSMVDGAFKPISIDFYINQVRVYGTDMIYSGTYKLLALEQNKTEQIKFECEPGCGCHGEFCQLPDNEHPTTYEFLHVIAEKVGLGFAATDQVKEISDDKYRFIYNQNYKDAIQQHFKFGGLDENSLFDCWIDLYRYLVIVNVPWVLNEDIELEDIGNYLEYNTPADTPDSPDAQDIRMSKRILSNSKEMFTNTNILIRNYKWITSNEALRNNGTTNQYLMGSPLGYAEDNTGSMNQKDIEVEENSTDGSEYKDDYSFQKTEFLGYEMGNAEDGNTPVLYQQQIRNNYFRKLRQRRLKATLDNPNMGLQRGTLVYLIIVEYNNPTKRNLLGMGMEEPENRDMMAQGQPLLNPYLTGFWYIDGMEFSYEKGDKKITQSLYLIKKDPYENPNSKSMPELDKVLEGE